MIIDNIDLKIILEFLKNKNKKFTTWFLMKKIFPKGKVSEHMTIKSKLDKMEKHGLFILSNENGKKEYLLIEEKVKLKKIKFEKKYTNTICFFVEDKWNAYEV